MTPRQRQLYRRPDLLKDPEADVARWLADQDQNEAILAIAQAAKPLFGAEGKINPRLSSLVISYAVLLFLSVLMANSFLLPVLLLILTFALCFAIASIPYAKMQDRRRKWLRDQLIVLLERSGRAVPLTVWISSMAVLAEERRRVYDALARRLATATTQEIDALTQEERGWLRRRLKDEWPGEALQVALLLALGTAGDIFTKPYARRLVTNPNESETVREAAEECLRALERAG
jgi:hypothetical protein